MASWQPAYFPEVTFPISNRGTDVSVLTCITFECLGIEATEPADQGTGPAAETGRDICYAIIVNLDKPNERQSFPVSVAIPPGETLQLRIAVGAPRSAVVRFALHAQFDRRGKTSSRELTLHIINDGNYERWYQPGIALECYSMLDARSSRDIDRASDAKPTNMIRSLYRQNRPLNTDYLRAFGPGGGYFFPADEGPVLPHSDSDPVQLEHLIDPTLYVAAGPAYAVRQLSKSEALQVIKDPRLVPPLAEINGSGCRYALNQYGACSAAELTTGLAMTQILPGCGLTGINSEIFTDASAARFIGATRRHGMDLIPWGQIHELAINTVNRYLDFLKEFCDLHGPVFVRAGLLNVRGLTLAHLDDGPIFQGQVVARGPLREEQFIFRDLLDHPSSYPNGLHVLSHWSEMIAADAVAEHMPQVFPRN